jgi:hypothetical protein
MLDVPCAFWLLTVCLGLQYFELHKRIYEWFDIDFDYFGRTSCDNPATDTEWPQTKVRGLLATGPSRITRMHWTLL